MDRSGVIELSFFSPCNEGVPLGIGKNQDRSAPVTLGVSNANPVGQQPTYLNAAAVHTTEGTLAPEGPADLGRSDSVPMAVRLPA